MLPAVEASSYRLGFGARIALFFIRAYQLLLSPLLGNVCRFHPSCSRYTATCIARFGILRGGWMGVRRISRCHPFHPGGIDLPPDLPDSDKINELSREHPACRNPGEAPPEQPTPDSV